MITSSFCGANILWSLSPKYMYVKLFTTGLNKLVSKVVCVWGGELLPIKSSKWNPNDVLTTCNVIIKVLASGFGASHHKPKINGLRTWWLKAGLFLTVIVWKFGNLLVLCRFPDIVYGLLFLLNNFPLQSLEYATYSCI